MINSFRPVYVYSLAYSLFTVPFIFLVLRREKNSFLLFFVVTFLPWVRVPNITFQHAALSTTGDTGLRLGCTGLWHRPGVQFLLCTAFHRLSAVFSFYPLKIPFCPSWFPHYEGFFLIEKISSHFQLPARVAALFFDSCFPFFLFLSSCEEIFLVLLGAWSLPLIFSRCSGELFHL